MEYPPITFLIFFANLLLISGDPSQDFIQCLSDSNSTANLIYTPQNPTYQTLLQAQDLRPLSTSRERPSLIVTPSHESHIVAIVYCSNKVGMQIRVRSGGHDYEGLSYTSDVNNPFVVVDMRNIRSISIDVDEKTARVQVGATLGQFYHAIAEKSKSLAFPAGVCPTVGVGGHFSGGGYGLISRKHAIASDHIIDAKLINAEGQILDRRSMGEDLFWAIRGGGGTSFGIVVEFKVTLVTIPKTVTFFKVIRTSHYKKRVSSMQLVHRWQYIADKMDENLVIRVFLSSFVNRTISASFEALYLGPVRDLVQLTTEQFPELGLVKQDCIEMSWIESMDFAASSTPPGGMYHKRKSDFVTSPIPMNGLKEIWKFLSQYENLNMQLSPYGGVLDTFSESESPFPHRKGNIFMIHYAVVWASPDESEQHLNRITRLYSLMARYVTKSPRAAYLNYRDLDIGRNNINGGNTSYKEASVWGVKYFKNNFRKLARVKGMVDPSNFFRNEQSIPPISSHTWGVM